MHSNKGSSGHVICQLKIAHIEWL